MSKHDAADAGVVRAFELPLHHADAEVWPLLRECWGEATMLANWCARHLLARDVVRLPGMGGLPKMPPLPPGGLYKAAREAFGLMRPGSFWAGAAGSFADITDAVTRHWLKCRPAVLWRGREQPPRWNYPHPFPVRGQEWKAAGFEDGLQDRKDAAGRVLRDPATGEPLKEPSPYAAFKGRPYVEVNLPSGTPRRPRLARLHLRGGPEFGRQMDLFRRVAGGALPRCQLVIRWQRCSGSCHRPTCALAGVPGRVMVKMVARLPASPRPGGRTLVLLTDPGAFWVAEIDGRRAWVFNADHARRAAARHEEHLRRLQRMSEDAKYERRASARPNPRWPPQQQERWLRMSEGNRAAAAGSNRAAAQSARLAALCHKDRNRLASFTHEAAAGVAGFAVRQGVGEVLYLDRDRGFAPRFPWFELHGKLADKCKAAGIAFYSESALKLSGAGGSDEDSVTTEGEEKCPPTIESRLVALRRLLAARKLTGSHPAVSAASGT